MDSDIKIIAEKINAQKIKNFNFFRMCADYLNNFPGIVTKEIIDNITCGTNVSHRDAFILFLSNIFMDDKKLRDVYEKEYFYKCVKELDPKEYLSDPYVKNIKIPSKKIGNCTLGTQKYAPYEGFIYRDIILNDNFCEIPQIGFFEKEYTFPTVFENGIEWMAIKPNEIETMKAPVSKMYGNVLVFGLGLGYFAYRVAQNENVRNITIIEKNKNVIKLFYDYIFPQFNCKNKIKVIESDAFDFLKGMENNRFDTSFVDLWHDVSDGVDIYIKFKKQEALFPNTKFEYWIEPSLLSAVRWRVFDGIYENIKKGSNALPPNETLENILSDNYLKNFIKYI